IGKFPESYKPLLPGGCGKQVCIRLIMEVSNTTAVTLTVDPSIATKPHPSLQYLLSGPNKKSESYPVSPYNLRLRFCLPFINKCV
ncbi:phage tail protein, partial [Salmonella enterica subsp. enterica serovar Anatum]|nr:phage tail protein [Salmonella enterica subsp. enterica serovar Anatum]